MTMNKKKYISTGILIFVSLLSIRAQVTIGSGAEPLKGALLQLKENENTGANSTKGLAMPRVSLTVTDDLTDIIPSPAGSDKEEHIGLVVYNINDLKYNFCRGLYVWDGEAWQPLSEQPPVPVQRAYGSVTDIDGNIYKTLEFGTQGTWMVENLRVLHNSSGAALNGSDPDARINPGISQPTANSGIKVGSWADINALSPITYTENGEQIISSGADFVKKFGLMYSRDQRTNLCPAGWHIPTTAEWDNLIQYFATTSGLGTANQAIYFQSAYAEYTSADGITSIWQGPICNGPQSFGFNALPIGRIINVNSPTDPGAAQYFGSWTDFAVSGGNSITFAVFNNYTGYASGNAWAVPVRCKKD